MLNLHAGRSLNQRWGALTWSPIQACKRHVDARPSTHNVQKGSNHLIVELGHHKAVALRGSVRTQHSSDRNSITRSTGVKSALASAGKTWHGRRRSSQWSTQHLTPGWTATTAMSPSSVVSATGISSLFTLASLSHLAWEGRGQGSRGMQALEPKWLRHNK